MRQRTHLRQAQRSVRTIKRSITVTEEGHSASGNIAKRISTVSQEVVSVINRESDLSFLDELEDLQLGSPTWVPFGNEEVSRQPDLSTDQLSMSDNIEEENEFEVFGCNTTLTTRVDTFPSQRQVHTMSQDIFPPMASTDNPTDTFPSQMELPTMSQDMFPPMASTDNRVATSPFQSQVPTMSQVFPPMVITDNRADTFPSQVRTMSQDMFPPMASTDNPMRHNTVLSIVRTSTTVPRPAVPLMQTPSRQKRNYLKKADRKNRDELLARLFLADCPKPEENIAHYLKGGSTSLLTDIAECLLSLEKRKKLYATKTPHPITKSHFSKVDLSKYADSVLISKYAMKPFFEEHPTAKKIILLRFLWRLGVHDIPY